MTGVDWGRLSSTLAPFLLAAAVFTGIAGAAVLPTVADTSRSALPVHEKKSTSPFVFAPEALVSPTTAPLQDTRPTVPPPGDLGSVLVDISDLGFQPVADLPDTGAFDSVGAVKEIADPSLRQIEQSRLDALGMRRGYRAVWRPQAGTPVVQLQVLEFTTVAGAEDEAATIRAAFLNDPKYTNVVLPDSLSGVGATYATSSGGKQFNNVSITVQRGARVYSVTLLSSRVAPDPQMAIDIATRQASAG